MKCLIIDDEPDARMRLTRLLNSHNEIEIIGEAHDGLDALNKIERLIPDLVFLDIEMPGLNGFELLHSLPKTIPLPLIIFVTGYDQHALSAFEADALAYLLKPVVSDRLATAVNRAYNLFLSKDKKEKDEEQKKVLSIARKSPASLRYIVCRKRESLQLIPPSQIFWFEAKDGIVKAKTTNDTYIVNYQISELEAALSKEVFFRARRETLINITKIKEIKPYFKSGFLLIMSDAENTEIIVSERRVHSLRLRLPGL